jgi:hypothetical protein
VWDEEASTPRLEPPATMWPSHRLTSGPAWGSGAGVGRLAHWSHTGGRTLSSGISTAVSWELPARAGSCRASTSNHASVAAGYRCGTAASASSRVSAAAGAGRLSTADAAGNATTTGAAGCTSASVRASAAAATLRASTTSGARRASATAGCGPVGDVTGRGLKASAAPCEPPLAAVAAPAPARDALDERRLVGTDASALSTLAGARGHGWCRPVDMETNRQVPSCRARDPSKDNSLPQVGEGALPLP